MIAPAATFIEMAQDRLASYLVNKDHEAILAAQQKELHVAVGDKSQDFTDGYMLGIETARVLLSGMIAAVRNNVSI